MPERFKVVCIPCKALYECFAFLLLLLPLYYHYYYYCHYYYYYYYVCSCVADC